MLLFVFMVFVLLHNSPWLTIKLPLLSVVVSFFGFNVHLLANTIPWQKK